MNITLDKTTTAGMLKAFFKVQTGGTLRIKNNGRKAEDTDTLETLGLTDGAKPVELTPEMTVGEFKSKMAESGLTVEVATSDDWVSVPETIALGQLRNLPRNATLSDLDGFIGKPLVEMVKKDIEAYLAEPKGILYNERDLQVGLATRLRQSSHKYDSVDLEYLVPITELINVNSNHPKLIDKGLYPWSNKSSMWIDIVVSKGGFYVLVELKYATKTVESKEGVTRFGEPVIDKDVQILKDQAASNLVMYNYWKDVRRIELVKQRYSKVVGGIALIVTNSDTYWDATKVRPDSAYIPFHTGEGRTVKRGPMDWAGKVSDSIRKDHDKFEIDGTYTCHWKDAKIEGLEKDAANSVFRYCLLEV